MTKEEKNAIDQTRTSGNRQPLRSSWIAQLAVRPWPPVIAWLGLSFTLSAIPGDAYPQVSFAWASSAIHVMLYTGLGLLLLRALRRHFPGIGPAGLIGLTILLGFCWGLSDEWHQEHFVNHRQWENLDLAVDAIGLAVGAVVYYALRAAFLRLWPDLAERFS